MSTSTNDSMWATVPRLLRAHRYLALATADQVGRPWVTPLFFVSDGPHRVLWVSAPESRHSLNVASRPEVALTIFDSHAPIGGAEALYLEASARLVDDLTQSEDLAMVNAGLPRHQHLEIVDLGPIGGLRVYEALVRQHFVLIRGGDPRFGNPVDTRLAVHEPDADG